MVEFYDYDDLAAGVLESGENRLLSGSMSVTASTTAEDLALLIEDMNRIGVYFIGIAYTGYNAEARSCSARPTMLPSALPPCWNWRPARTSMYTTMGANTLFPSRACRKKTFWK